VHLAHVNMDRLPFVNARQPMMTSTTTANHTRAVSSSYREGPRGPEIPESSMHREFPATFAVRASKITDSPGNSKRSVKVTRCMGPAVNDPA